MPLEFRYKFDFILSPFKYSIAISPISNLFSSMEYSTDAFTTMVPQEKPRITPVPTLNSYSLVPMRILSLEKGKTTSA